MITFIIGLVCGLLAYWVLQWIPLLYGGTITFKAGEERRQFMYELKLNGTGIFIDGGRVFCECGEFATIMENNKFNCLGCSIK